MSFAKTTLVAAVVASAFATSAMAETVALSSFTNAAGFADTRTSGTAVTSTTSIAGTNNLVRISTTETGNPAGTNQEKVAPFFYSGTLGSPIGTLADLGRGGLTADWRFESRGSTTPSYVGNVPAFRIRVAGVNGNANAIAEIIWETGYQASAPTVVPGTSLDNLDIGSGNYYVRYNSQNFGEGSNGPVDARSLSAWTSGTPFYANWPTFNEDTVVLGMQASIGSDAGDYVGYVGDINATFVPEPGALAVLGLGGIALLRRRRA